MIFVFYSFELYCWNTIVSLANLIPVNFSGNHATKKEEEEVIKEEEKEEVSRMNERENGKAQKQAREWVSESASKRASKRLLSHESERESKLKHGFFLRGLRVRLTAVVKFRGEFDSWQNRDNRV